MASVLYKMIKQELTTSALENAEFMQQHITPKTLDENLFEQIIGLSGEAKEFLLLTLLSDMFDGANIVPKSTTQYHLLEVDLSDNVHPDWEGLTLDELVAGHGVYSVERAAKIEVDKLNSRFQQELFGMEDGDDYLPPRFYMQKASLNDLVQMVEPENAKQCSWAIKRVKRVLYSQILTDNIKAKHGIGA